MTTMNHKCVALDILLSEIKFQFLSTKISLISNQTDFRMLVQEPQFTTKFN